MTRKTSIEIARRIRDNIRNFNNVYDEMGFDLYTFKLNEMEFNVFAYVRKQQDEQYPKHKWYAVYSGVKYADGDTIYADYDNSTEHLRISELANTLFWLSNKYKDERCRKELIELISKLE